MLQPVCIGDEDISCTLDKQSSSLVRRSGSGLACDRYGSLFPDSRHDKEHAAPHR